MLSSIFAFCWSVFSALLACILAPLRNALVPAGSEEDYVLVGLAYSHYVELARWSLTYRGHRFREIKTAVGPHIPLVALFRLAFFDKGGSVSSSSFPGSQKVGKHRGFLLRDYLFNFGFIRRLSAVPLVIGPARSNSDGVTQSQISDRNRKEAYPDSWSVFEACGMHIDQTVKHRLDSELGPRIRQIGYYHFLDTHIYRQVQSVSEKHFFGRLQMLAFDIGEHGLQTSTAMKRMMDMTPEKVAESLTFVRAEFDAVAETLSKPGVAYLGDALGSKNESSTRSYGSGSLTFGGADLAFCALAGWLILPPGFHAGAVDIPEWEEIPTSLQKIIEEFRAHRAGKHIRMCYEKHRLHGPAQSDYHCSGTGNGSIKSQREKRE